MTADRQLRILLALIACGLFANVAVSVVPRVQAAEDVVSVQRVEIVNWPRGLAESSDGKPLPVYVMNGRIANETKPQIPVLVINPRYN